MPNFAPADLLEEITLATDDLPAMRRYLEFHNLTVTVREHPDFAKIGGMPLTIADPEGHRISFVQWSKSPMASEPGYALRLQISHAGFPVRNRAAEDSFYKDILGFHIYWHGAMKDGAADDWVAMQVPDGTDWLEYMLNVPPDATHRTLGVMNHISLGVPDIRAEYDQLVARGWKPTAQPNMGRDGKWQLNLFDPDDTRIEFMEFTPKEKPCCSLFTGSQPGPQTVPPAKAEGPTPR
jgi:catechol 2,3-dioxygenase-like lactoylglutathione lyase family enzyme